MTAPTAVEKVAEDFDKLTASYRKILELCHRALAPEYPQRDRNQLRDALAIYLKDI